MERYKDITSEIAAGVSDSIEIALVTATTIESEMLRSRMEPAPGEDSLLRVFEGHHTYYLGKLGNFIVVHTQCEMGGVASKGATLTVRDLLEFWKPKAVVMPGIAFGIDPNTQRVADVLISRTVIPYDSKKVEKGAQIPRGKPLESGKVLFDRFCNQPDWKHLVNGEPSKSFPTDLLSGETLINDVDFRDELLAIHTSARGGEMEGAGLSAACSSKNIEWIVVKGICDFADGNKDLDKDERQRLAAAASVDLVVKVLSTPNVFEELECKTASSIGGLLVQTQEAKIEEFLFDSYSKDAEPFYLSREHDENINEIYAFYSLWLFGKPGGGKTASVRRLLERGDREFYYLSLGAAVGSSYRGLLEFFYGELSEKLSGEWKSFPDGTSDEAAIKIIESEIREFFTSKPGTLYIDELPVESTETFRGFVRCLATVIMSIGTGFAGTQCKFVFSSINDPQPYIPSSHQKVHERLKIIETKYWNDEELAKLCDLLLPLSKLVLAPEEIRMLLRGSSGSPRIFKSAIKDLIVTKGKIPLERIISELQRGMDSK